MQSVWRRGIKGWLWHFCSRSFIFHPIYLFFYMFMQMCAYILYMKDIFLGQPHDPLPPQNPLDHLYRWSQGVIGESGHVVMLERRD